MTARQIVRMVLGGCELGLAHAAHGAPREIRGIYEVAAWLIDGEIESAKLQVSSTDRSDAIRELSSKIRATYRQITR